MSYARLGDTSDVYVFLAEGTSGRAYLDCCACWLEGNRSRWFRNTASMIAHLDEHQAAGHKVPSSAYDELLADQRENDHLMGV